MQMLGLKPGARRKRDKHMSRTESPRATFCLSAATVRVVVSTQASHRQPPSPGRGSRLVLLANLHGVFIAPASQTASQAHGRRSDKIVGLAGRLLTAIE